MQEWHVTDGSQAAIDKTALQKAVMSTQLTVALPFKSVVFVTAEHVYIACILPSCLELVRTPSHLLLVYYQASTQAAVMKQFVERVPIRRHAASH